MLASWPSFESLNLCNFFSSRMFVFHSWEFLELLIHSLLFVLLHRKKNWVKTEVRTEPFKYAKFLNSFARKFLSYVIHPLAFLNIPCPVHE